MITLNGVQCIPDRASAVRANRIHACNELIPFIVITRYASSKPVETEETLGSS